MPKPNKKKTCILETCSKFSNKCIPKGNPQPHPKINYSKNSVPELFCQTNMFNPSQNFFYYK